MEKIPYLITPLPNSIRIAVLIPCYNEEAAIADVIKHFRETLPNALIYVYDNNSRDRLISIAREAGAIVRSVPLQGKGNVVRRMFADVDADIYVLVDGDDTYDATSAPTMIHKLLTEQLDMVNGMRVTEIQSAYRRFHRFGNRLLTGIVAKIFGDRITDMLSGYRVFSRRFVKSFPALSSGFEIETELTVHALELGMPVAEIETAYKARPEGSLSKLHTFRDGFKILSTILVLIKEERPTLLFSYIFLILALTACLLCWPVWMTFLATGQVDRLPTAILSMGFMLLAFLSLMCGIILETVTRGRREMKRIHYLAFNAPDYPVN